MATADSPDSPDAQVAALCEDLLALRGAHGQLTVDKFSRFPRLVQIFGDGDLLEAYVFFKRHLSRFMSGNKFEAAAAWSILADAEKVIDRLQVAADETSHEGPRDQRTARHWSDRGMPAIARDLAAFAELRGSSGRAVVGIIVSADRDHGVGFEIAHHSDPRIGMSAPEAIVRASVGDRTASERVVDLGTITPAREADHTKVWHLHIAWPTSSSNDRSDHETVTLVLTIGTLPQPAFFVEHEHLPQGADVRVFQYRSRVEVRVGRPGT